MDSPMRKVNTRFFFILLISTLVFAGGLFGVHRLQAGNIAQALLWQAAQAEKNGKATLAARYLGQYLEFVPDDIDERAHLAAVLSDEKVAITPGTRRKAEFAINQVLAWDPQRHELRQALCRMALVDRRLPVAEEHLVYLEARQPDSGAVAFLTGQVKELQLQVRAGALKKAEQELLLKHARQSYDKAVRAEPTNAEAYLRLIAVLRQQDFGKEEPKNTAEIDRLVTTALKHIPENASVLSLAAQRAQEKGETAEARSYLENGLKQNPKEPRLYLALARLDNQRGDRARAIGHLKKGLEAAGKEHQVELSWMLANLLIDAEDIEPARKIIAQTRGINALSADYLEARCMMYQGRWYDAARTLSKLRPAFKVVPELALQVDLFLGLCHQKVDEPLLALADFQRAAQADSTSQLARHGEAMALAALGQRVDALKRLRTLIDNNPDRAEAGRWRLQYARMLLAGNPNTDAELGAKIREVLAEAEKEPGQVVECALVRSALAFAENKAAEAQAELHRIIQADPKRFEPWLALAELAMTSQQPEQAVAILEKAGSAVPDTIEYRLARVPFWSRYGKERPEPLRDLEQGLDRFPVKEQARMLQALADGHYRAGRPAQAVRLLEQVAALPPHAEDVRVRMLLFGLALAQDDEPAMQRVLAEVKRIEGEPATEWCYGEARRLIWRAHRESADVHEPLKQARGLLNTASARRPDWPALFLAHGDIDELEHKPEQAIVSYRRAIDLGSRDPYGVYQLIQLLTQAQRFDEAEQLVRKMDQIGIGTGVARLYMAQLAGRDEVQAAMPLANRVIHEDSKNFRDHLLQGQLLSSGGRFTPEAEAAFRRSVALGPRQPETWIALVRYLGSTGQYAKAVDEIHNAALKLDENVKLVSLASCYEALGALDEAELRFKKALAQQPKSTRLLKTTADFLLRFNKPREAEPLFRAVVESPMATDDERAFARRGLALALARGGNPQQAPEALKLVGLAVDEAGRFDERSVSAAADQRLVQARVLSTLSSHALRRQAIKLLEAMHQQQSLAIDDQFQLAYLLHLDGPDGATWKKARDILSAIATAQPHDTRYLAAFANLLLLHRESAEAEALIGRLEQIERDRKLPTGLLGAVELKARALELRGKTTEAIALLADFAKAQDAVPTRKVLLAGLHGRVGNYQEAVDLCFEFKDAGHREEGYGAALGILRSAKPAATTKVRLERWKAQLARVEESLRESRHRDADNAMLMLQLADLHELAGRFDMSISVYRDVLKADADNVVALNNLAWMLADQETSSPEALELIQRAIDRHGARPELLNTRGVVYLGRGMAKEAVCDLEQAVREAPTSVRYFHLTRAHHLAKNAPQALAALQRANELGLTAQQLQGVDRQAYDQVVPELQKQ
jgi:tetratricopeptide (TPR) repeat protein